MHGVCSAVWPEHTLSSLSVHDMECRCNNPECVKQDSQECKKRSHSVVGPTQNVSQKTELKHCCGRWSGTCEVNNMYRKRQAKCGDVGVSSVTDCKELYDSLVTNGNAGPGADDRRSGIEALCLGAWLRVSLSLKCVQSAATPADGPTITMTTLIDGWSYDPSVIWPCRRE